MSMRISDGIGVSAALLMLASCTQDPDNAVLAEVESAQVREAAQSGRIFCALAGADGFRMDCTLDRMVTEDGSLLVLGRADVGYRRLRIANDGRGVVAADGAEQATVSIIDNGLIEVRIADDRYRLPATIAP